MKIILSILLLSSLSFCKKKEEDKNSLSLLLLPGAVSSYNWNLPSGYPLPKVPESNLMTEAKVKLGRFLFYDKRLSGNETMSCASCHLQKLAFSDGKSLPQGITGVKNTKNSIALVNVAYNGRQNWANSLIKTLEEQAGVPLQGVNPVELGLDVGDEELKKRLMKYEAYESMFKLAFPGETEPITLDNVKKAIAAFQRTLISSDSPYDRYTYKNNKLALSASALRGMDVFNGEAAECFHCHGGFNFTDSSSHTATSVETNLYHSNGLYNINGSYPSEQRGLIDLTGIAEDMGKFKAPTLRNIALTYPYMHDGSIMCDDSQNPEKIAGKTMDDCATDALGKVIDQYMNGGNNSTCRPTDPNFPCRTDNNISTVDKTLIRKFSLSSGEKADLINFLKSLTDETFISNPAFSDPFVNQ
ncbi:MAG: di-heme enzyme [Leptospiraceae bacterium]|nr:di-heme enzyme [Leptospiraceae bacterium]MCP5500039.1 di-heme enzyme [Leptospiraceae bacterium]